MDESHWRRVLSYSVVVGAVAAIAGAIAQLSSVGIWPFALISLLAFPLVGVSVFIHSTVAVIAGYAFGNAWSVAISAGVMFAFFASVGVVQSHLWLRLRERTRHGRRHGEPERAHVQNDLSRTTTDE